LLQYVLTEVFERREGRVLTLSAYQDSGGALGALARRATELYNAMDAKHQAVTRQLFLRLVTLGEGAEDTRRRIQWAELMSFGVDNETLREVMDGFGKYRLLSFDRDPQTREPTVEVAHEALIREWKQLREWLSDSREDVRLQRTLAAAAAEWVGRKRDGGFLLTGTRLGQFEEWAGKTDLALASDEKDFLAASTERRKAQEAAEIARVQREKNLERQNRNVLIGGFILAVLLAVVAVVAALNARTESQRAQEARSTSDANAFIAATAAQDARDQQTIAQRQAELSNSLALAANARQLESSGAHGLALALAIQANLIPVPPDSVQRTLGEIAYLPALIRQMSGHSARVSSVVFSPDGRYMLSGGEDNVVILWETATGAEVRRFTGHILPVAAVAFSADGQTILSGSWDQSVILWDVNTGAQIRQFGGITGGGHRGVVQAVAFNPDGVTAMSGSVDGLILWNLADGSVVRRFADDNEVLSLAFSADGTQVLIGTNGRTVSLWDTATGEMIRQYNGHTAPVTSVAFAPDDVTALSGSRDNIIIQWDVAAGRVLLRLNDPNGVSISDLNYSPDGLLALAALGNGAVTVWDLNGGRIVQSFLGHSGAVASAAFSADNRLIVSGGDDQTVRLWNVQGGASERSYLGHLDSVNAVAFSADGARMASVSQDNQVIVWETSSGAIVYTLDGHSASVNAVAFTTDGNTLVTGGDDNLAIVWDLRDGSEVSRLNAHTGPISSLAISPDGQQVVTGSDDTRLILWNISTGRALQTLTSHTRRVLSVAFSADGTQILSGANDRSMILWDANTGSLIRQFGGVSGVQGHNRRVLYVTFTATAGQALSASDDNTMIVWDLNTGAILRRFEAANEGEGFALSSAALSPNGMLILSGSDNGQMTLWDLQSGQSIRRFNMADVGGALAFGDNPRNVVSVRFALDGATAVTGLRDGSLVLWAMPDLAGLVAWTQANRLVPELTCDERAQYGVTPLCAAITPTP
jgi:WD40 repeat protein